MPPTNLPLILLIALGLAAPQVDAHGIVRREQPGLPIASSITVPAGAELIFIGGTLADVSDTGTATGSAPRLGNTADQARSVLGKIQAELVAAGYTMGDIVKMEVYLVADPAKGGQADMLGLLSAYTTYFDTAAGGLPTRTTVQVAGLPLPGALVQIAVTAARANHPAH
jgi:enamine deaminase RidA (YjgF/YER057c/UK114 family)